MVSPPIQKLNYPQTEVIEILIEAAELISGHSLDLKELMSVIQRHEKGSSKQLLEAVFKGIHSFTKEGQAEDDRTMIAVKVA